MAVELLKQFKDDLPVSQELYDSIRKECRFVQGYLHAGDLCLRRVYEKVGHDRLKRLHKDVEHPTDGVEQKHTIHAVLVYDHLPNDKDRGINIVEGGIGQKHVKVQCQSKAGHGLEFTVIIIGQ